MGPQNGVIGTRKAILDESTSSSTRNLVECAELIVRAAPQRHESRGLHYSRDYADTLPVSVSTVLVREVRSRNKAVQSLGRWRDMPR